MSGPSIHSLGHLGQDPALRETFRMTRPADEESAGRILFQKSPASGGGDSPRVANRFLSDVAPGAFQRPDS